MLHKNRNAIILRNSEGKNSSITSSSNSSKQDLKYYLSARMCAGVGGRLGFGHAEMGQYCWSSNNGRSTTPSHAAQRREKKLPERWAQQIGWQTGVETPMVKKKKRTIGPPSMHSFRVASLLGSRCVKKKRKGKHVENYVFHLLWTYYLYNEY